MIINSLARHKIGRIALIPVVIGCGAWSWFSYLDGTKNVQDAARVRSWWGWLSAAMEPHWQRLSDPANPDYGSWKHSAKNVGAEWSKLDPQRSFKSFSFLFVVALLLAIALAVVSYALA